MLIRFTSAKITLNMNGSSVEIDVGFMSFGEDAVAYQTTVFMIKYGITVIFSLVIFSMVYILGCAKKGQMLYLLEKYDSKKTDYKNIFERRRALVINEDVESQCTDENVTFQHKYDLCLLLDVKYDRLETCEKILVDISKKYQKKDVCIILAIHSDDNEKRMDENECLGFISLMEYMKTKQFYFVAIVDKVATGNGYIIVSSSDKIVASQYADLGKCESSYVLEKRPNAGAVHNGYNAPIANVSDVTMFSMEYLEKMENLYTVKY